MRFSIAVLILVLAWLALSSSSCDSDPARGLPDVVAPGKQVVRIEPANCSIDLPPIHSRGPWCYASQVGTVIEPREVCQLLLGLRSWFQALPESPPPFQPEDLDRIESITVCSVPALLLHDEHSAGATSVRTSAYDVWLEARIPGIPYTLIAWRSASGKVTGTFNSDVLH